MSEKWDKRFLALAEHIARWSKDPSTKIGAVIVDPNKRVVSLGYNCFPRGVEDSEERLENREVKYKIIVHCERNALLAVFGLETGATKNDVNRVFKRLAKQHHPDVGGDQENFVKLARARERLMELLED